MLIEEGIDPEFVKVALFKKERAAKRFSDKFNPKGMSANVRNALARMKQQLVHGTYATKGTVAQMKQGLTIDEDLPIDEGNFDGVIKGLIGKYQHMCPPQLRPILQDPAIVSFLLSEAVINVKGLS